MHGSNPQHPHHMQYKHAAIARWMRKTRIFFQRQYGDVAVRGVDLSHDVAVRGVDLAHDESPLLVPSKGVDAKRDPAWVRRG